ncbi:putative spermidine/putrescine transport system substrate-binding protein [Bradyrhizobium sp. GM24.11]
MLVMLSGTSYQSDGSSVRSGSKQGFWEKLDTSLFDIGDLIVAPHEDSVTYEIFSGGIGWNPSKFGPGKYPTTFAEFLDLQKFPGRRALRAIPNIAMEVALLGDGVAPKNLYPLDIDRAFKALDRIKPSVASWVKTTPQTISLLQTGEVDFCYTYSNRVKATNEPGGGVPLAFSFEQTQVFPSDLAVLKGARNKENAMKLVAYYLRPEVQANVMNETGLTPVSKKAGSMMSAEARKWQPDLNNPNNVMSDTEYWADNLEPVTRRFKEWMQT